MNASERSFPVLLKDGTETDSLKAVVLWHELRRLDERAPDMFDRLSTAVESGSAVPAGADRERLRQMFLVERSGHPKPLIAAVLRNSLGMTPEGRTLLPPFRYRSDGDRDRLAELVEALGKSEEGGPERLLRDLGIDDVGEARDR